MLIPFLVSRQIYAGAGKVLHTARGATYSIAQRAEHIWEGVSSATTRSRPIINTRDEPHADAERYRRLHVIVGDSNMSEYTTFLKVGAAACMLRMLEDRSVVLRDMTLENPIRAIREISHDPTCRRTVRLGNGREVSALDIQREYLDRALRYADTKGFPPLEQRALEMWEHCVTTIENDPAEARSRGRLGDQVQAARGVPRAPQPAVRSPAGAAARPAVPRRVPRPAARSTSCRTAAWSSACAPTPTSRRPPTCRRRRTRARLRGEFVRRAKERKRDYTVDWVHLKLNDQAQRTVLCKDPFKSRDERVEKLIESL